MPMYEEPVVGTIYEDEDGKTFEVIAFDENIGTVEVEFADGTKNEIDLDDWYGMDLEEVESEDEDDLAVDAEEVTEDEEDDLDDDDEEEDVDEEEDE
jgi:ribonuclease E